MGRKHKNCEVKAAEQKDEPDGADDGHPGVDMGLADDPREVGGPVVPGTGLVEAFRSIAKSAHTFPFYFFQSGPQPTAEKKALLDAREAEVLKELESNKHVLSAMQNEHFFESRSALLLVIFALRGNQSQQDIDALLEMVLDPGFDPRDLKELTGRDIMRLCDKHLPLIPLTQVTCAKTRTTKTQVAVADRPGRSKTVKQKKTTPVKVQSMGLIHMISRFLNNPVMIETLAPGQGLDPINLATDQVQRFNQTPVARRFNEFSGGKLLKTRSNGFDIRIGGFVYLNDGRIGQLLELRRTAPSAEAIFAAMRGSSRPKKKKRRRSSDADLSESGSESDDDAVEGNNDAPVSSKERRKLFPQTVGWWREYEELHQPLGVGRAKAPPKIVGTTRMFEAPVCEAVQSIVVASDLINCRGADFVCLHVPGVGLAGREVLVPYTPIAAQSTPEAMRSSHCIHVFVDVAVDAYKHNVGSTEAVYVRINSTDRAFQGRSASTYVNTLLASDVSLDDALAPLRLDAQLLNRGIYLKLEQTGEYVLVCGTVGTYPADSVQMSTACRHGGNASFMNCPTCLIGRDERMTVVDTLDEEYVRDTQKVNAVVAAITSSNESKNAQANALKFMGICLKKSAQGIFRDHVGDPIKLAYRDPDHLFCFGLLKQLTKLMIASMQSKAARAQLGQMVHAIQWPTGTPVLISSWRPAESSKEGRSSTLTMRAWVQLSLAIVAVGHLFIEENLHAHFVGLFRFYATFVLATGLTDDQCVAAKAEAERLHVEGVALAPTVYDRPNGHGFICFAQRLHLIRNASLVATGPFERRHQVASKVNHGAQVHENTVIDYQNRIDAMSHLLTGGWVGGVQARAAVLRLVDELPVLCRQFAMATLRHRPDREADTSYRPVLAGASHVEWSDNIMVGLEAWAEFMFPDETVVFRRSGIELKKLESIDQRVGKASRVGSGDDVAVQYGEGIAYSRILRLAQVQFSRGGAHDERALLFQPAWYDICMKRGKPVTHAVRQTTQLVVRTDGRETVPWLPASDLLEVVLVVHSCQPACIPREGQVVKHVGSKYEVFDGEIGFRAAMKSLRAQDLSA